jgi:hypothetical protein
MSENDLKNCIKSRAEDFVPVRLHLSNGQTIDIRFPEAIMIGRTATAVLIDGQISWVGNLHINRVEPLATVHS